MQSKIETYLNMDLNPVAIIWSNDKPDKAVQYKPGKFACAMYLVAQVAKGKTVVLDADTSGCFTAAAAFGFGKIEDRFMLDMDYYYATLSCGMKGRGIDDDLKELITAASKQGVAPQNALHTILEGEGFKQNRELVKEFVDSLPDVQIEEKYVVMKPLKEMDFDKENPVQIVFFVNPNQLSALITLANFLTGRCDMVKIGGGSGCQDIGLFAYQETREEHPKAILGFTDVNARNNLKPIIGMDKLTFTVPMKLFKTMEENADESLFSKDSWKKLMSYGGVLNKEIGQKQHDK